MRKGFTLVELLISITIVAILAALGFSGYAQVLRGSRDAERLADIKFIQSALEQYHGDQKYYPTSLASPFISGSKTYLTIVPKDPKDKSAYSYEGKSCDSSGRCTGYCLYAKIENGPPVSDTVCAPTAPYTWGVTRP